MADDEYEMEWSDNGEDQWNEDQQLDENDPKVMIQNNFFEGEGLLKSDP